MSNNARPGPETIEATVKIEGHWLTVPLMRVAADGDADRPWRIEAPGGIFDGWLVADSELRHSRP